VPSLAATLLHARQIILPSSNTKRNKQGFLNFNILAVTGPYLHLWWHTKANNIPSWVIFPLSLGHLNTYKSPPMPC
jgi:hypothetical protein